MAGLGVEMVQTGQQLDQNLAVPETGESHPARGQAQHFLGHLFHNDARQLDYAGLFQAFLVRMLWPFSYLAMYFYDLVVFLFAGLALTFMEEFGSNRCFLSRFCALVLMSLDYIWIMSLSDYVTLTANYIRLDLAAPFFVNCAFICYLVASPEDREGVPWSEILVPAWLIIGQTFCTAVEFNLKPAEDANYLERVRAKRLAPEIERVLDAVMSESFELFVHWQVKSLCRASAWFSYCLFILGGIALAFGVNMVLHLCLFFFYGTWSTYSLCLLILLAIGVLLSLVRVICSGKEIARFADLEPPGSWSWGRFCPPSVRIWEFHPIESSISGHVRRCRWILTLLGRSEGYAMNIINGILEIQRIWKQMPLDEAFNRRMERIDKLHISIPTRTMGDEWAKSGSKLLCAYLDSFGQGSVSAPLLAWQFLVGFSYPASCVCSVVELLWQALRGCLAVVLALIWIAIPGLLRSRELKWVPPKNLSMFLIEMVWMSFGTQSFMRAFVCAPLQLSALCTKLTDAHESLNLMLSGSDAASRALLPHVTLDSVDGILVWAEVRGLLMSSIYAKKVHLEAQVGFLAITMATIIAVALHYIFQDGWKPGVLSAVVCLAFLAAAFFFLPSLIRGVMLNMKLNEQTDAIAELLVESVTYQAYASRTPDSGADASVAEGYRLAHAIHVALRYDSRNVFKILGTELTPAGLTSIISIIGSAGAYILPVSLLKEKVLSIKKDM